MKIAICLVVVMLVAGLVGACAEPAPAPAPAPAPTPTPAPSPAPAPIEFTFAQSTPPVADLYKLIVALTDKITEESGGRLTFVHYAAGAIVPMNEYWKAIQVGTMDAMQIGMGDYNYHPTSYISRLPFLGFPSQKATNEIMNALLNKYPEMSGEYEKFGKLFNMRAMAPDQLHLVGKEVKGPDDMKGLKIAAQECIAPVVQAAGGAPVDMQLTDWYMSLENGLIDGVWNHFAVIDVFGLNPLLTNHTIFIEGGSNIGVCGITFNWDSWNSLPPDIQDIIMGLRDWYQEESYEMTARSVEKSLQHAKEAGAKIYYCTPEEFAQWRGLGQPVYDDWLEKMKKIGHPGEQILADCEKLIAEYPSK